MEGAKWEIARETIHTEIPDVARMPLPAQVIFRAAEHFASKAADGADVVLRYDYESDKPHLVCETKRSSLAIDYVNGGLIIRFSRTIREREFKFKKAAIRCDVDTAKNLVYNIANVLTDAVVHSFIHSTPDLDKIFNLPPHP
jgi:hypothetical protein